MKTLRSILLCMAAAMSTPAWSAAPRSDVLPAARRASTVEAAIALTQPPSPAPLPSELKNPFNPPDFNAPDPDQPRPAGPSATAEPAGPMGDREILETIAARIQPTGSIVARGKPLLTFSGRTPTVGVGQSFVVTYENQDHELEVVSIDRTTFTLRYRGEELTRPIKPTR